MITIFTASFGFSCFLQLPSRESSWKGQASCIIISCDSCTFMACRKSMTWQQENSYFSRALE